jgi:quercetin dioxygenase-like cupin family protein
MTSSAAAPTGVVVASADAEDLEFPGGSSMRLLAECIADGGETTVHRSILRSGAEGAGPHHHERATELIYVLDGALVLLIGDRVLSAGAGDLAVIPPGVTHAFTAEANRDAEILDVTTSATSRFDLFRSLSLRARGLDVGDRNLDDQSVYDTYPDDRPGWYQPAQEPRTP